MKIEDLRLYSRSEVFQVHEFIREIRINGLFFYLPQMTSPTICKYEQIDGV